MTTIRTESGSKATSATAGLLRFTQSATAPAGAMSRTRSAQHRCPGRSCT
ncbi:hypothetical protein AB0D65_21585 [Streptomyces griseoloalbus]|uniref:Uncharacterized protein n=1 Tax=Streptomyces griseoloalbus TaxID=67303 RepID=A0ABV3EBD9_9ACTN